MKTTATIKADRYIAHAPARVWRALTDSERMGRWLMPNTFQPVVGHAFTLDTGNWGLTQCEVLAIEPERLLRISWRNGPIDTTITWRLEAEGAGTHLYLEHAGFDLDHPMQKMAYEGMGGGWRGAVTDRLVACLDEAD